MDELTKYAADVIEFIAGGILFLTALLIWGYLYIPVTLTGVIFPFATTLGEVSSLALGIGLLGITYTLGVFAEGASRVATEWRLRRLTCETMRSEYVATPAGELAAAAESRLLEAGHLTLTGTLLQLRPCSRCRQTVITRRASSAQGLATEDGPLLQKLCAKDRAKIEERVRQRRLEEKREEWRSIAYRTASGAKSIDAQLKRLRIERTLLLSIALITVALATRAIVNPWIASENNQADPTALWILALSGAVLVAVCAFLVNERFRRFLATITRAHALEVAPK